MSNRSDASAPFGGAGTGFRPASDFDSLLGDDDLAAGTFVISFSALFFFTKSYMLRSSSLSPVIREGTKGNLFPEFI